MTYSEIKDWLDKHMPEVDGRPSNPFTPRQFINQFSQELYDVKGLDYIKAGYIQREIPQPITSRKETYYFRTKKKETKVRFVYRDLLTGRFVKRLEHLTRQGTIHAE